jgi:hypothetical protein
MPRGTSPTDEAQLQRRLLTLAAFGPSLDGWWDVMDATTLTIVSGLVSELRDKSGNNRHLTQPGSNTPLYVEFSNLNGRPALRNRAVDTLGMNASPVLRNVSGATMIVVARFAPAQLSASNSVHLFVSRGDNPVGVRLALSSNLSLGTAERLAVTGRRLDSDVFGGASSTTGKPTSAFIEVGVVRYADAQIDHFTNGAQDIFSAPFQTAGNTSDTDAQRVSLFGDGSFASPGEMEIGEAVILSTAISAADRERIEGILAHKWGIELPASHPFLNRPPLIGD